MRPQGLRTDESAVSPVIGVILLVAIAVTMMATIGTFVLGFGPADQPPRGEVLFEQESTGGGSAVNVTVADADRLFEEEVTVEVEGEAACDSSGRPVWDGQGSLDPGDTVSVTETCSGGTAITDGDTVQVVWYAEGGGRSEVLDSYEVH